MHRFFRIVGKPSSKSDLSSSKSTNALANGTKKSESSNLGSASDENLSPIRQKRLQNPDKRKCRSLIESFHKFKRPWKSGNANKSADDKASDSVPSGVKEAFKTNGVVVVCESETTIEDHCPQKREVSVNGDVTSLSLSTTTLRSMGSTEASAVGTSGDAARADFLAREVSGSAAFSSRQLEESDVDKTRDCVSEQFGALSLTQQCRTSAHLDVEQEIACSEASVRSATIHLNKDKSPDVFAELFPVPSGQAYGIGVRAAAKRSQDNIDEEGKKIHETLPVDMLYASVPVARQHLNDRRIQSASSVRNDAAPARCLNVQESPVTGQSSGKWSLMRELNRLSRYGWYWGPVSREEAEEKLADQPEGAFLFRDSTDERYLFSLSFRSFNRTLHTRIEYCNGNFSFYHLPQSEGYQSLVDLIENAIHDSLNGIFYYSRTNSAGSHSYAVKLTKPVSRFSHVRSLQYLCRFIIRQHTRVDHMQNLPLPVSVKGWLTESQY